MNFSKMLHKARNLTPELGELEGTCCICGIKTKQGHKKKFGANFTSADYISNGDVICEYCKHLVDNSNEYRRTMFIVTENDFKTFKKQEAKEIVLNIPNEPYYLYLTKTWQKVGWVLLNRVKNENNTTLNCLVDYDIINTTVEELKGLIDIIEPLRELKIPKGVLETGNFEMYHVKKLHEKYSKNQTRFLIKKLKNYAGNPVWDLAVYLVE